MPRVASLNLCTDEYALLLAVPEQIVSLTHLSQQRREFPWWRSARLYPANDGSIASVAAMRPDILLSMGGLARDHQRLADVLGAELIVLPYPQMIADIDDATVRIASALGQPARGERLRRQLRRLITAAPRQRSPGLFLSGGGQGFAEASLGDQWLGLAGIVQPQGYGGQTSAEQLLRAPPRRVIRSDYRSGQTSRGAHWIGYRILRQLGTPQLRTDGRRWTCAGPALIPEIRQLRRELGR